MYSKTSCVALQRGHARSSVWNALLSRAALSAHVVGCMCWAAALVVC